MSLNMKLFCLLLISCAGTYAKFWKDCESTGMTIDNVVIPGCSDSDDLCYIEEGKNNSISITFTPKSNYSSVTEKMCAIIGGLCITPPFKFPEDVCSLTAGGCPFISGKQYTEKVTIYVDPRDPIVRTVANWTYYAPDSTNIGCLEIALELKKVQ